jgi:integrase
LKPKQPLDAALISLHFLFRSVHQRALRNFRRRSRLRSFQARSIMPRLVNRLSKRRVEQISAARTLGMHPDGNGLYLQVTPRGAVSWIVMYRHRRGRRKMGLGPLRLVSLEEARAKRDAAHKLLLDGVDPLASRATKRARKAGASTFRAAAKAYIEATEEARKNPKNAAQWRMTLLGETPDGEKTEHNYCAAILDLPVSEVDTQAVLSVLKPVWSSKPETASRLRGRIEAVLSWAALHGLAGDIDPNRPNPARWKGHLQHALLARDAVREVKHHAALDYRAVPDFLRKLRTREGLAARALELAILTAVRTGDLIGSDREERPPMKREHVNLAARMWTVPKTKTNVSHRIPLSGAAAELLARIFFDYPDDGSGVVFVGDRRGAPLSDGALLRVRDRMVKDRLIEKGAMTTHGFRASFKSWASDETSFERDVVEAALTHTISDKLEAAYRRSDFLEKRRQLMASWAGFLEGKAGANMINPHA